MSRVIKVRIWDKQDKIYYKLEENAPFNAFIGYKNGDASLVTHEVAFVENDNFIVEQYTGLKDKNGVEIYEGDIIEFENKLYWYRTKAFELMLKGLTQVEIEEKINSLNSYQVVVTIPTIYEISEIETEYKVIGNIHE